MSFELVNPESLGVPRGWNHGILTSPGGRLLFVAGQAGWEEVADFALTWAVEHARVVEPA